MRPPPSPRRDRRRRAAIALWLLALGAAGARADNAVIPDTPEQMGLRGSIGGALELQVLVNGHDSRQIVPVVKDAKGRFLIKRGELAAAGVKAGIGPASAMIALDSLPFLKYRYDEAAQTLALEVPEAHLAPHVYKATPSPASGAKASSAWGLALNYDFYAATAAWAYGQRLGFGAASAVLEGRAFSPYGVFNQSGILGATALDEKTALRLDTSWRYDDDRRDITYVAGDLINAGLPWTRPVRLGGVQVQHGFGLRPDLVVGPSATVSGSAAVPSSVDVYVNNFKIFSQDVEPGPYRIQNLPAISGGGTATLVTHDVTGKPTTSDVPFFVSSRLLAPGAIDYSAEAGWARLNYGLSSFDYDPHLVGSASLRGGIADWATLEGHLEGGAGLINGGAGVTVGALQRAVIDASIAGSHYGRDNGVQFGLEVSTGLFGATLDVSTQHALFDYLDLAAVTAPQQQYGSVLASVLASGPTFAGVSPLLLSTSIAPPRALDRASLSIPSVFGQASLNLSFVNQVDMDGAVSRIASVGVSRNFKSGLSTFATAYADFANRRDYGVVAGLSYAFGRDVSASTQSSLQAGGFAQTTQVTKSAGQDVGDYGWTVEDQEGLNRFVQAGAAYQSSVGRATVLVDQYGKGKSASSTGSADFSGSAVFAGGGVSLAPHIADSFAVVQAGAPGVTVLEDNRVLGKTDASGRLLAPNLRSFQDNKLSIDPTSLPLDAQSNATEITLRPRAQSGVVADFRVRTRARDAEVILVDEAGRPLPPGVEVERPGHAPALVGYDGRAYLSDLDAHTSLTARVNGKTCAATFDFAATRGRARPTIGPVACRGAG